MHTQNQNKREFSKKTSKWCHKNPNHKTQLTKYDYINSLLTETQKFSQNAVRMLEQKKCTEPKELKKDIDILFTYTF